MKSISKLFGMLSLLVLILGALLNGILDINVAGAILVIGVLIFAASETAAKIIVPLAGFLLFVWTISKGNINDFKYITFMFLGLLGMLTGLYIMVKPVFRTDKKSNNYR